MTLIPVAIPVPSAGNPSGANIAAIVETPELGVGERGILQAVPRVGGRVMVSEPGKANEGNERPRLTSYR